MREDGYEAVLDIVVAHDCIRVLAQDEKRKMLRLLNSEINGLEKDAPDCECLARFVSPVCLKIWRVLARLSSPCLKNDEKTLRVLARFVGPVCLKNDGVCL